MKSDPVIAVREMVPTDVDAVAILIQEFGRYMRDLGDTTEPKLTKEVLTRDGFGPHRAFEGLVAEVDGKIEGFLLHHGGFDTNEAVRLVFIVDLFVSHQARGSGIGTTLVRRVAEVARSRSAAQLVWTVDKRNTEAVRFYERLDGRIVDWLHLMYLDL